MNEEFLSEVTEQENSTPEVVKPAECNPNSILSSIKKMLPIPEELEHFDVDIIIHINTALMVLTQLGVGPAKGFSIVDKTAVWTDFVPDIERLEAIKTYVYLKVKLVFDPPQSAAAIESLNKQISEYEWRINVAVETTTSEEESKNA